MRDEAFEVIRGSGNVYRDLDKDDADARQLKALPTRALASRRRTSRAYATPTWPASRSTG